MAEVYANWNNKDKAISYYQQALAINQAIPTNSPVNTFVLNTQQGLIQVNIANAYAATSKYEQAIKFYEQAITTLKTSLNKTGGITTTNPINADLVVLSACQTGQGTLTGDGVIGLSRSLIAAGTKSVVVSLWSVDDASTKLLMTEIYRQMQKTPNKGAALRTSPC